MIIAAYCRVSTDKDEQIDSLIHQKEFFREYARRNGHELYQLYADEGISGTSLKKREEFKRLLRDAEQGKFQMVVVKDISRFARNTVDALQSIRKLKSMGINTLFLTANMDSMGDSEFILTLFSAMAQEESNNLSKRVKWGKRMNAEKGRVPLQIYGYDRLDNFTLQVNADEARVIRKIFSLYIEQGLGCRTISRTLNQAGDKTKMGKEWNARGVRRVLVNPLYCGVLVNHKYEIENFLTGRQVCIPSEEHFFHDRPGWAIVSRQTFQEAQRVMENRRIQYDSGQPFRQARYSGRHIFSTLIKCAHCGRSFTRKTYTYANTRVYWRCVTNDQYTAEKCDNRVCLDESELMEQLRKYFSSLIENQESFITGVLADLAQKQPAPSDSAPTKKELEAKRQKLLAKKFRYQEMYANNLISMEELKDRITPITAALKDMDTDLANAEQIEKNAGNAEDILRRYRDEITGFLDLKTVTNVDMRRILELITVSKDGSVCVVLKKLEDMA